MKKVDETRCPMCGELSLIMTARVVAGLLGSYSLSGNGMKFNAQMRPVLTCSSCPFTFVGAYEGEHAVFTFE